MLRSLHLHRLYFPHMHGRWCEGPSPRLPRRRKERQALQKEAYFFLPPVFFSALPSLGAAAAAASFLLSFLPGMLCLLSCVGKLVAEQALAFKCFDVGSKWRGALCELGKLGAEWFLQERISAKIRPELVKKAVERAAGGKGLGSRLC
jgi:hypothetical protein